MHQHDHTTDPDLMGANELPTHIERALIWATLTGMFFGALIATAGLMFWAQVVAA